MKIIQNPNQILRKKAKPVQKIDKVILEDIKKMETALKSTKNGVAIAAPQLGISKAIIFAKFKAKKKKDTDIPRIILLNPKIIKSSQDTCKREEGCLSFMNPEIRAMVSRPRRVTVLILTGKGKKKEIKARGFLARVLQHEIDHLNGILFVDKADPTTLYKVSEEEKNEKTKE